MDEPGARARSETWLWIAQRVSAAVLSLCVLVHLVTIAVAVRGGLDAAEIVARVGDSVPWLLFYLLFVLAAAVHAPIGVRAVLRETTPLPIPALDAIALVTGALMLLTGAHAVLALHGVAS